MSSGTLQAGGDGRSPDTSLFKHTGHYRGSGNDRSVWTPSPSFIHTNTHPRLLISAHCNAARLGGPKRQNRPLIV